MARIQPFTAYRYDLGRVRAADVVTQPYDKITPDMRRRYLERSPYNIVRVILGEQQSGDNDADNVYTRATTSLREWIDAGIVRRDSEPGVYPYTQSFDSPDTGKPYVRRGFIALGGLEDYTNKVVFRHEQTLSGPKLDRQALLRATRTHFGQIFMLYSDPGQTTEGELMERATNPILEVTDDYGTTHRLYREADAGVLERLVRRMADHALVIADGHHRYETALQWRNEQNALAPHRADRPWNWAMMTFVNMDAPGMIVLPTHRLVHGLAHWDAPGALAKLGRYFTVEELPLEVAGGAASWDGMRVRLAAAGEKGPVLGVAVQSRPRLLLLRPHADLDLAALLPEALPEQRRLDVLLLHRLALELGLGITPEMVREEQHLRYLRSAPEALESVAAGAGQAAFFLNPIAPGRVREVALAGGVMPQKSTDFFPKLLTGLTMYRVD